MLTTAAHGHGEIAGGEDQGSGACGSTVAWRFRPRSGKGGASTGSASSRLCGRRGRRRRDGLGGAGDGEERALGRDSSNLKCGKTKRGEEEWVEGFGRGMKGAHHASFYRGGGGRRWEIGRGMCGGRFQKALKHTDNDI